MRREQVRHGVMESVLIRVLVAGSVGLKGRKELGELKVPVILSQPRNTSRHGLTLLL